MSIEPAGYTTAPDPLQRPCLHCGKEGYDAKEDCIRTSGHVEPSDCDVRLICADGHLYEPDERSLAEVRGDDDEERRLQRSEER